MTYSVSLEGPIEIRALADEYTSAHPVLDPDAQRLVVALYRLLAAGAPVPAEAVAAATGVPEERVVSYWDAWSPSGIDRDARGRATGVRGLTLEPSPHAVEVEGRSLYAPCALDALLLPKFLGVAIRVSSACPLTGTAISLVVDPDGPRDLDPRGAAMTVRRLGDAGFGDDPQGSFCDFIHFFASADAAAEWSSGRERTLAASIADGFELMRLHDRDVFRAVLDDLAGL